MSETEPSTLRDLGRAKGYADPEPGTCPECGSTDAELSRLRGVVEAVQALADEWDEERRPGMVGISRALRAVLAPVSSSGEAESGEAAGAVHAFGPDGRCPVCGPPPSPAPVPSGGQADGEGEGWPDRHVLSKAVIDVCWKATQYGETEDGDTFAYILPKGAIHRLVGAAQSAGVPAALRAAGVPAPEDEPAARPVLSREALRDPIAQALHAWDVEGGPCEGPWDGLTDHQREVWLSAADAVLDVLAGGEQA